MSIYIEDSLTFTVALAQPAQQLAERFCQYQSNLQKAEQVYLNTLAVYAVDYYLQCLGFATDWPKSDSWDTLMQTFLDVADLVVKGCGKLECRAVLPETKVVCVPQEVWEDRIGYVVVQLDESLREAMLLGFVETVTTPELPLAQLRSLENLPSYLSQFKHSQVVREPANLSQWLHGIFEAGWDTVEAIFASPVGEFALSMRSLSRAKDDTLQSPDRGIKRGKRLDLGREDKGEQVAILVGLTPASSSELDITVEVYPTGGQTHLPSDLKLIVLDEQGKAVLQAEAGSSEGLEFQFSGEPGESFSVKVVLDNFSITEQFAI